MHSVARQSRARPSGSEHVWNVRASATRWRDRHLVAHADGPRKHGSSDHGSGAREREASIDGEPETATGSRCHGRTLGSRQACLQQFNPLPRRRRDGKYLRIAEARRRKHRSYFIRQALEAVRIGKVCFCDRDQSAADAEQIEDREMFERLGFDAIVCRNDQHGIVDAARAGEHGMNEALVTGDVDKSGNCVLCKPGIGKAEIDGVPRAFSSLRRSYRHRSAP